MPSTLLYIMEMFVLLIGNELFLLQEKDRPEEHCFHICFLGDSCYAGNQQFYFDSFRFQ